MCAQPIHPPPIAPVDEGVHRPFWSVMIPAYNRTEYLERTLRSVLSQADAHGKPFRPSEMQIEVLDNASDTSEVEALVRRVDAEAGGGRVGYFRHPWNLGPIGNWNACVDRARGRWVHILHDDDFVLPGFYKYLQQALVEEVRAGAAFCRHRYVDVEGAELGQSVLEREAPGLLSRWIERLAVVQRIQMPAIVVKRQFYEENGGFMTQVGAGAADWEMWQRVASRWETWFEPQVLACYTIHNNSVTSGLMTTGANIADLRRCIRTTRSYLPRRLAKRLSRQARELYALSAINDWARQMFVHRNWRGGLAQLREALRCSVSPRVLWALGGFVLWLMGAVGRELRRVATSAR